MEANEMTSQEAITFDPMEELVPIRLFKDGDRYNGDVFVAVNGERVQIRRGETVMIKRKFANVLEQSLIQDEHTADMMRQQANQFATQAAKYNI